MVPVVIRLFTKWKDKDTAISKIKEDVPILLAYGTMKNVIDLNQELSDDQKFVLAVKTVFRHFGEDYMKLFITVNESESLENIQVPHVYPLIIVSEKTYSEDDNQRNLTNNKYHLIIEYNYADTVDSMQDAIILLISAYFVFNKTWPKDVSCFLEFAQMRWSDIYPLESTRSKSKAITDKVFAFYRKLAVINSSDIV